METFDLPSPWAVGAFAGVVILLATSCVIGVPLGIFREAWRWNRSSWNTAVETVLTKGAYRGMPVALPIRVQIPRIVVVASIASLYIAVPMTLMLPVVFVGACDELAHTHVGPAIVFGLENAVLTIAIVAVGIALTHRSPTVGRAVRIVGTWELAHAIAIAGAVAGASTWSIGSAWDVITLDGGGVLLAPYALASAAHAFVLLAAARAQERVAERVTLRACA